MMLKYKGITFVKSLSTYLVLYLLELCKENSILVIDAVTISLHK